VKMGAMKSLLVGLATLFAVAVLPVLGHMAFIEIGREVVTLRTQRPDSTWQKTRGFGSWTTVTRRGSTARVTLG